MHCLTLNSDMIADSKDQFTSSIMTVQAHILMELVKETKALRFPCFSLVILHISTKAVSFHQRCRV